MSFQLLKQDNPIYSKGQKDYIVLSKLVKRRLKMIGR